MRNYSLSTGPIISIRTLPLTRTFRMERKIKVPLATHVFSKNKVLQQYFHYCNNIIIYKNTINNNKGAICIGN
jgi:hypothetical protein